MGENTYDVVRLDKAIEQIALHPETWQQDEWRCGTGMCLAEHIVEQNGDQWATGPEDRFGDMVLVPEDTPGSASAEDFQRQYRTVLPVIPKGMSWMTAETRANSLLRLFGNHSLFASDNTLREIRMYRDMMARGEIPRDDEYYDCMRRCIDGDEALDEGAYATLVQDVVQGWHLVVGSTRHEILKTGSEVWVEEFLQLDDPEEEVTDWDAAYLFKLIDEALHGAGYRLDFTRPSQPYAYLAVSQLGHEIVPEPSS
ncbi:hypothetical protein [Streptomyces sp. NPDC005046]